MEEGCRRLGIILNRSQLEAFLTYRELLLEWNRRVNLISRKDEGRIVAHHFLDSLVSFPHLDLSLGKRLLDLGSGAGFPGVPLKIVAPQIRLTLLDSKRKRVLFLRKLVNVLQLEDVNVLCERAEHLGKQEGYTGKFDYVVARAVMELNRLVVLALPFLRRGGRLIAYKGPDEVTEAQGMIADVSMRGVRVSFPKERDLVIVEKM